MATGDPEIMLDTSFVVRYLTNDPPDLAARAAAVVDSPRALAVSAVVLAEVWYVLRSGYQVPREAVLDRSGTGNRVRLRAQQARDCPIKGPW